HTVDRPALQPRQRVDPADIAPASDAMARQFTRLDGLEDAAALRPALAGDIADRPQGRFSGGWGNGHGVLNMGVCRGLSRHDLDGPGRARTCWWITRRDARVRAAGQAWAGWPPGERAASMPRT